MSKITSFFSVITNGQANNKFELTVRVPWRRQDQLEVLDVLFVDYMQVFLDELKSLHSLDEVLLVQVLLIGSVLFVLRHLCDHAVQTTASRLLVLQQRRRVFLGMLLLDLASITEEQGVSLCCFEVDLLFFFFFFVVFFVLIHFFLELLVVLEGVEVALSLRLCSKDLLGAVVALVSVVVVDIQLFEVRFSLACVCLLLLLPTELLVDDELIFVGVFDVVDKRVGVAGSCVSVEPSLFIVVVGYHELRISNG